MNTNRRSFLRSLAGLAALAVVPKRLRAAAIFTPARHWLDDPSGFTAYNIWHGSELYTTYPEWSSEEWQEIRYLCNTGRLRCDWKPGNWRPGIPVWRMGLIDRDHVPEGTKLEEWEVRAVDTDTGYFADVADDIEQWWIGAGGRLFCSDSRPDMHLDKHPNLRASQGACYTGKVHAALFRPIHFVYTGPHPIYSRLFPIPSMTITPTT